MYRSRSDQYLSDVYTAKSHVILLDKAATSTAKSTAVVLKFTVILTTFVGNKNDKMLLISFLVLPEVLDICILLI